MSDAEKIQKLKKTLEAGRVILQAYIDVMETTRQPEYTKSSLPLKVSLWMDWTEGLLQRT